MEIINISNLTQEELDEYRKKGYAIDLYMDVNEIRSLTMDQLLESGIIGDDFKKIATTIMLLMKNNPDKYVYAPILKGEYKDKFPSIDEYLMDGGSIMNLEMNLSLK